MAACFGTIPAVAAFWMAFRFAHLLRRLFGEGALNAAFIPHFERLRKDDPKKGARFFYDLSLGLTLILLVLTITLEVTLGGFLIFKQMSEGAKEVVRLTMILLPALLFISLYALNTSLLNCERSYFIPSVAPAALNLVWIAALALLWNRIPTEALQYLAMILVFAFALQWLVTLPKVLQTLRGSLDQAPFSPRELLIIARPFLLGMIGVAATQINSALDAIFARLADPQGPALLWYAIRLQQLPLALFGIGLTGALLPPISRAFEQGNLEKYRHFIRFACGKAFTLMLPTTCAIFVLGFASVNLIYGHGAFNATAPTTLCLFAYGAGLFPMTLVLIFASAFYAQKNYRTPTLLSLAAVSLNIVLNALFVLAFHWGPLSIALATTLTSLLHASALIVLFDRTILRGLFSPKLILLSLLAASLTLTLGHTYLGDQTLNFLTGSPLTFSRHLPTQLFTFLAQALLFGAILFFPLQKEAFALIFPSKKER